MQVFPVELGDYCSHCGKVTESKMIGRATGVMFVCAVCGSQVDYLYDEEDVDDAD